MYTAYVAYKTILESSKVLSALACYKHCSTSLILMSRIAPDYKQVIILKMRNCNYSHRNW